MGILEAGLAQAFGNNKIWPVEDLMRTHERLQLESKVAFEQRPSPQILHACHTGRLEDHSAGRLSTACASCEKGVLWR